MARPCTTAQTGVGTLDEPLASQPHLTAQAPWTQVPFESKTSRRLDFRPSLPQPRPRPPRPSRPPSVVCPQPRPRLCRLSQPATVSCANPTPPAPSSQAASVGSARHPSTPRSSQPATVSCANPRPPPPSSRPATVSCANPRPIVPGVLQRELTASACGQETGNPQSILPQGRNPIWLSSRALTVSCANPHPHPRLRRLGRPLSDVRTPTPRAATVSSAKPSAPAPSPVPDGHHPIASAPPPAAKA